MVSSEGAHRAMALGLVCLLLPHFARRQPTLTRKDNERGRRNVSEWSEEGVGRRVSTQKMIPGSEGWDPAPQLPSVPRARSPYSASRPSSLAASVHHGCADVLAQVTLWVLQPVSSCCGSEGTAREEKLSAVGLAGQVTGWDAF